MTDYAAVAPPLVVEPLVYREDVARRRVRRAVDAAVAVAGLAVASPLLGAAMLAIFIEDGSPVFFRQKRAGRFGRLFTMWKLRTMRKDDCSDRLSPTSSSDARITRVGKLLRKTSVDELPQLLNVLRGDMSLVGPRPEMPFVVRRYQTWQHLRHLVTPGLTCLWQVEHRSTIPLHRPEATALDLKYIRNATALLDLALVAKTLRALVLPKGAY